MYWLAVLIIFFGIINLLRMTMFIIGSDLYELKMSNRIKKRYPYTPSFTVIIPAHNEQSTLLRAVHSIIHNHYPQKKLQVIVTDDGSTDDSKAFVKSYRRHYRLPNIEVLTQQNSGKAHALNHALRYAKGKLLCA